jgi:hypothetical protein
MGTIHDFRASSHASAICAAVAFFRSAILVSRSTTAWFASRASAVNRGNIARKSVPSNVVAASILLLRNPLQPKSLRHH